MTGPNVVHYRPPRARVAVAYSTKDRTDLTRLTVAPLIDDPNLDLYWFDGSATEPGRQLPFELCADQTAICELHQGVVGGPDRAIMYALQTLRARSYDLVILVENDVMLSAGWFAAMYASIERAEAAGFRVGAASVRVFAERVLSFNGNYCLMLNSGAGFIALTPPAIDIVLANYRTLTGVEFIQHFRHMTGIDVSGTVEFQASQPLSVDFIFDLMLYLHGYVVAAPAITFASMIDVGPTVTPVTTPDDHLPQVRFRITRPDQISPAPYPLSRFQQSPRSDRLLIGCHQLMLGVNSTDASTPVRAGGSWRRIWLQAIGPFGLLGAGEISVAVNGLAIGLLFNCPQVRSQLWLSRSDGSRSVTFAIEPRGIVDFPLTEANDPPVQDVTLHVASGQICLIGLTANAADLSRYANSAPSIDHLPP
jgi:hypothetical protein